MELLALFVSSLGHDLDHRGTNNQYQMSSVSTREDLDLGMEYSVYYMYAFDVCLIYRKMMLHVHVIKNNTGN